MENSQEPKGAETRRRGLTAKESVDAFDANGTQLPSNCVVSGRYKYDGSTGRFYLEERYGRSGEKGVAYLMIHRFPNTDKKAVSEAVELMTHIVTANNGEVIARVTNRPTQGGTRRVEFCTLENEATIKKEESARTNIEFPSISLLARQSMTLPNGMPFRGDIERLVEAGVGNVAVLAKRPYTHLQGKPLQWAAHDYGKRPYYATLCARKNGEPVAFIRIDSIEAADQNGFIRPTVLYLGRNRYEADLQIAKEEENTTRCIGIVNPVQTGAAARLAASMTDHQLVEILDERRSRLITNEIGRQKLARWEALIDQARSMPELMPALKRLAADVRAIQDEYFKIMSTEDIAMLGQISGSRLRAPGDEEAKLSQIEAWLEAIK